MRTALSRMVAAGELSVDDDGYRLVGRLLERKAAQDIGRRPATGAVGRRRGGSPSSRAPRRSIAERRAFRTAHGQPADGRAAAGHVDAPGQPRRPDRRRLARRRARPAAPARTRSSWPARLWPLADAGRRRRRASAPGSPTPRRRWRDARPDVAAGGDRAGRRGRAVPARRAAAARRADPAPVAARRAARSATASSTALVGRALADAVLSADPGPIRPIVRGQQRLSGG